LESVTPERVSAAALRGRSATHAITIGPKETKTFDTKFFAGAKELDRLQAEADVILKQTLHCYDDGAIDDGALQLTCFARDGWLDGIAVSVSIRPNAAKPLPRPHAAGPSLAWLKRPPGCCSRPA